MGGVCRLGEQVGAGTAEDVGMGIDAPTAKLILVREAFDAFCERNAERFRRPAQRRGDEEAETHQRGNGVSGQADHRSSTECGDALGAAGLLIHMPEPAIENLAYYFKFPGGNSARGNDGVRWCCAMASVKARSRACGSSSVVI